MAWKPPADEVVNTGSTSSGGGWTPPADEVVNQPSEDIMSKTKNLAMEFGGNVLKNALDIINPVSIAKSAGQTIKQGLLDVPLAAGKTAIGVTQALAKRVAGTGTTEDVVKSVTDSPIIDQTRKMTQPIAQNPGKFAFERPLDAAAILLGPILPFLGKGAGAAREVAAGADTALPEATKAVGAGITTPEVAAHQTPSLGRRLAAKTISATLGAPEEAVLARMDNPAAAKTAFSHPELADQMANSVKNLGQTVSELDTKAMDTLSTSPYLEDGAVPKTQIRNAIVNARRDLGGVFSDESQKAVGALKNVVERYKKLRNTVSETQVKDLVQQLDSDINWDDPNASRTNEALVGVRRRLDDILKAQNPDYKAAMVPVAEGTDLIEEMQKRFGIKKKTGRGYIADDASVNKIKNALKEDRIGTQSVLDRFQKLTGEDFTTKIKNANVAQAFEGATTNGSRRAVLGGLVGGAAGWALNLPYAVTSLIGGVAGAFADIYGRRVAGVLADTIARSPGLRHYLPALAKASLQGSKAVAQLHARIMEHDPDYTQAMAQALHSKINGNGGGRTQ